MDKMDRKQCRKNNIIKTEINKNAQNVKLIKCRKINTTTKT